MRNSNRPTKRAKHQEEDEEEEHPRYRWQCQSPILSPRCVRVSDALAGQGGLNFATEGECWQACRVPVAVIRHELGPTMTGRHVLQALPAVSRGSETTAKQMVLGTDWIVTLKLVYNEMTSQYGPTLETLALDTLEFLTKAARCYPPVAPEAVQITEDRGDVVVLKLRVSDECGAALAKLIETEEKDNPEGASFFRLLQNAFITKYGVDLKEYSSGAESFHWTMFHSVTVDPRSRKISIEAEAYDYE